MVEINHVHLPHHLAWNHAHSHRRLSAIPTLSETLSCQRPCRNTCSRHVLNFTPVRQANPRLDSQRWQPLAPLITRLASANHVPSITQRVAATEQDALFATCVHKERRGDVKCVVRKTGLQSHTKAQVNEGQSSFEVVSACKIVPRWCGPLVGMPMPDISETNLGRQCIQDCPQTEICDQ